MKTLLLDIRYRWTGSRNNKNKNFYEFNQSALIHKEGSFDSSTCYNITNHTEEKYISFKDLAKETEIDWVIESIKSRSKDHNYFKITFADHTSLIITTSEELIQYMNSLK